MQPTEKKIEKITNLHLFRMQSRRKSNFYFQVVALNV